MFLLLAISFDHESYEDQGLIFKHGNARVAPAY
jgi:hypothetical protein